MPKGCLSLRPNDELAECRSVWRKGWCHCMEFNFFLLRGRWLGGQTSSPRGEVAQLLHDRCSMEQGGQRELRSLVPRSSCSSHSRPSRLSGVLMGQGLPVGDRAVSLGRELRGRGYYSQLWGGWEGKAVNQVKDPTEFLPHAPHTSSLESVNWSDHTHSVSAAPHGIHFPFIFLGSKWQC